MNSSPTLIVGGERPKQSNKLAVIILSITSTIIKTIVFIPIIMFFYGLWQPLLVVVPLLVLIDIGLYFIAKRCGINLRLKDAVSLNPLFAVVGGISFWIIILAVNVNRFDLLATITAILLHPSFSVISTSIVVFVFLDKITSEKSEAPDNHLSNASLSTVILHPNPPEQTDDIKPL